MDEQGKIIQSQQSNGTSPEQITTKKLGGTIEAIGNSQITKIIMIGFLTLLLQIPIFMISDTVRERQSRSHEAEEEIASKWGGEQRVIGPFITIPYEREIVQNSDTFPGKTQTFTVVEHANFLPEDLKIEAKTDNQLRHRGIFEVPVYRMDLSMKGRFALPNFSELGIKPSKVLWEQAHLNVLISDPRTITNQATLIWNEEKLAFQPRGKEFNGADRGILVGLKDKFEADSFTFSSQFIMQGSGGVFFAPMGRNTEAALEANWSDPSFQGSWLPAEQSVDKNGFRAAWQIPSLGRNFSQGWIDKPNAPSQLTTATVSQIATTTSTVDTFGVNFIRPVDTYRMAERSIKYQFLFLALTFITLWLFEVLAKVRLHALQYLLVGAGMCLFYLLELSLAEHLGFLTAYLLAAASIVLLESFYCMAILKSPKRSAVVGAFISLLYGYLYTLLINQDYALLAGSIGLFLLLGTIMYLTRKIDWYGLTRQSAAA